MTEQVKMIDSIMKALREDMSKHNYGSAAENVEALLHQWARVKAAL